MRSDTGHRQILQGRLRTRRTAGMPLNIMHGNHARIERMAATALPASASCLFSHVTAEKSAVYRAIMDLFSAARRQFRHHLRPDEVLLEARWPGERPTLEEAQQALAQLVEWGNLQAQPDTARVATIEDFYRKRLLYRLTSGGEAV